MTHLEASNIIRKAIIEGRLKKSELVARQIAIASKLSPNDVNEINKQLAKELQQL